jgi:hypothetical protein
MNASLRRTKSHGLFGYQKEWLRWDLMAGLITTAVVIYGEDHREDNNIDEQHMADLEFHI